MPQLPTATSDTQTQPRSRPAFDLRFTRDWSRKITSATPRDARGASPIISIRPMMVEIQRHHVESGYKTNHCDGSCTPARHNNCSISSYQGRRHYELWVSWWHGIVPVPPAYQVGATTMPRGIPPPHQVSALRKGYHLFSSDSTYIWLFRNRMHVSVSHLGQHGNF